MKRKILVANLSAQIFSRKSFALLLILTVVFSLLPVLTLLETEAQETPSRFDVASYWAPIWHQGSKDPNNRHDYFVRFDFDGNWDGSDNRPNIWNVPDEALAGYIYYSVVETASHWFLGYWKYQTKDFDEILWNNEPLWQTIQHNHDSEGVLLTIRKNGNNGGYGSLEVMTTVAHNDFYTFTPSGSSVSSGTSGIDGEIHSSSFLEDPMGQHNRPEVWVEQQSHGIYGVPDSLVWCYRIGDHRITYLPKGVAEVPQSNDDDDVGYALIDLNEPGGLWSRRFDTGPGQPFSEYGYFNPEPGEATTNAFWALDDVGDFNINTDADGHTYSGEILYNPADMLDVRLDDLWISGPFEHEYTYNPYAVEVRIDEFWVYCNQDGDGTYSDPYITMYMFDGKGKEIKVMGAGHAEATGDSSPPWWAPYSEEPYKGSQYNWQDWDSPHYTDLTEEWDRDYFYGIRYPGKAYFGIRVRDADGRPDEERWPMYGEAGIVDYSINGWVPFWVYDNDDEWLMGHYWTDDGWNEEDETHTHWYGPPNPWTFWVEDAYYGRKFYCWGGSEAWISLLGDVPDVDTTPPEITVETPLEGDALQDGVTLRALITDQSAVDWVTLSIREPGGELGKIIDPALESMSASQTTPPIKDEWQLPFDTNNPLLPDGNYLLLVKASDIHGNEASEVVGFSIRNWAAVELLPSTANNKAGRTMPIKFSMRVKAAVDPSQPFIWNEELMIRIFTLTNPAEILQTSTYGIASKDYRIDPVAEKYITNFKTLKTPCTYVVEVYRKDLLIDSFKFATVK